MAEVSLAGGALDVLVVSAERTVVGDVLIIAPADELELTVVLLVILDEVGSRVVEDDVVFISSPKRLIVEFVILKYTVSARLAVSSLRNRIKLN